MAKPVSATILLSRQHLRPSLSDVWVKNLILAVNYVQNEGWVLNSSVGSPNWDIISACASMHNIPLRLFVPDKLDYKAEQFLTDLKPIELLRINSTSLTGSADDLLEYRDKSVISSSDTLILVSIRPNGKMSSLALDAKKLGKHICTKFQTEYDDADNPLAYSVDQSGLSSSFMDIGQKYLIHWTRTTNGPWPNESLLNYYRDILKFNQYPRLAIDTLRKISRDKMIIASSKNMPGKVPTVSFSSLEPIEAIKLMKWRARYHQMTFEPFGIGIAADIAESYGIKKVNYYDSYTEKKPESTPNWLTQSIGNITDWRNECEYRHLGNLDLSKIPVEDLLLVCHYKSDAEDLKRETGIEIVFFCD